MSRGLTVALLAAGAVLYYATSCVFWPYGQCRRCKGNARHKAWWGNGFRMCSRCCGSGRRIRLGRLIFNYFQGKRRDAK